MILTRRFYMVLILIILLMGSGYAFAPLFTIGQGLLFLLLLSVLADGYMLSTRRFTAFSSPLEKRAEH